MIRNRLSGNAQRNHQGRRPSRVRRRPIFELLEDRLLLSGLTYTVESPSTRGLSLASGQTEIIDVSKTPVLDLSGNLDNQGTIYLVSTNPNVTNISISGSKTSSTAPGLCLPPCFPRGVCPGIRTPSTISA